MFVVSPVPCLAITRVCVNHLYNVRSRNVPVEGMQQDPICANLLRQAQAAESEAEAKCFRLAAQRVWSKRHCAPTLAYPKEYSAPNLVYPEEESSAPIVVGVGGSITSVLPQYYVSLPPSVCSSHSEHTSESEAEDHDSIYSEVTVRSEKGCPQGEEFPHAPSEKSNMSCSHYPASEEPMSLGQGDFEGEEEMEMSGGEVKLSPGVRASGGIVRGSM
ncbi:uncharacterized protein LOC143476227 [Brachyhypopomus gauderio]|uniref:uncharacterized protein LOC143476227 n=1 Tax=Brachyhypopomus gauderio TaxID=698409 RepID=UPI00404132E1